MQAPGTSGALFSASVFCFRNTSHNKRGIQNEKIGTLWCFIVEVAHSYQREGSWEFSVDRKPLFPGTLSKASDRKSGIYRYRAEIEAYIDFNTSRYFLSQASKFGVSITSGKHAALSLHHHTSRDNQHLYNTSFHLLKVLDLNVPPYSDGHDRNDQDSSPGNKHPLLRVSVRP
jgi:hypothetical protein